ncbi:MAG TPA: protein kinase [Vicinamibacterales bacterium]|nr:protein kinase [Vicinamibacterales bacterium]
MPLSAGARLGPYEIVAPLGSGGMGQVYRARDTKLNRDVAVKALPDLFATDPERVARFEREAQLLAALNHQHIAAIYGLEQASGAQFLILELVEGESLADTLARGPLPLRETLAAARQIVDALEAAHEKAIVHRDLKPANIMVTPDGHVKVLDFGLAKALETEQPNASLSPTLTFGATQAGVILGTAAYMSPEQAKGRLADKRSDVWAFGCVLFEMLTGRRAFEGEDVSDTLACVLRGEPAWTALPADVPSGIRALVKGCLEKDRRARIPDISVVRFLMADAVNTPVPTATLPSTPPRARRRLVSIGALGVVAGVMLALAMVWGWQRWTPPPPMQPVRFAIAPPAAQALTLGAPDRHVAISNDGKHIVYTAGPSGDAHLAVRAIDRLEALSLQGTTRARSPFLSPDGRWIAFFAEGENELRKVSITGGPTIPLCKFTGAPRGGSWGADGTIVFATASTTTGLLRIGEGGGEPAALTTPDEAQRGSDHVFPSLLPDGRGVLFTIAVAGQPQNAVIAVLDLETGNTTTLIRGGSQAEYVDSGHIVYAASGALRAVRFDPVNLKVLSDPVPVADDVMMAPTGAANYAVSRSGTLLHVMGGSGGGLRSVVWVDRQGGEVPINSPPRNYTAVRVSPDGTRAALVANDQEQDIWIWDFRRGTLRRLTLDPAADTNPVWMPDSRRIIFNSARTNPANLFSQAADGTGAVERLTTSPNLQIALSTPGDGSRLILMEVTAKGGPDLHVLLLESERRVTPLLSGEFLEVNADLSRDGRWLAYQSDESGRHEIYVRPFPSVDAGQEQISTHGGTRPVWSSNGRELFFLDGDNHLTSASVQHSPTFRAGTPVKILDKRYFVGPGSRPYDVSSDGRFLMVKDTEDTAASMVVVLNWLEELKSKLPPK